MNEKAFTLVELMGVITILSVIALIAFPPLLKHIKDAKTKIDEANEKLIIVGASNYIDENKNDFPKTIGNVYCITLETLVNQGKISKDLKNSDETDLDLTKYVKVGVMNNNYTYKITETCTEIK